jgi:WhiB family redox-sensing transcriptional regulator
MWFRLSVVADDWRLRAACRGCPPDLWYPKRGEWSEVAVAVCRRCPVRVECLDAGIGERWGIWGGVPERMRRRIRRAWRQAADREAKVALLVAIDAARA